MSRRYKRIVFVVVATLAVGTAGLLAPTIYYIYDFHKRGYYIAINKFQMVVLHYYSHYLNTDAKISKYREVLYPNHVTLSLGDLSLVLGDHRDRGAGVKGYVGIIKLTHRVEDFSPFVPIYAGLIFGGRQATLKRKSDSEGEIQIFAAPGRPGRLLRFTLVEPHYVDIEVIEPCGRSDASITALSYLNRPEDPAIYVVDSSGKWRRHYDPVHGAAASIAPAGVEIPPLKRVADALYPHGTNNFADGFVDWRYRPELALFYGRFKAMVLIFMFPPNSGVIPFMSPSGGGTHLDGVTNPAWDWRIPAAVRRAAHGDTFRMRLVYKPFVDNDDALREYRAWTAGSARSEPTN